MPTITVTTDTNGYFQKTEVYDAPTPFPLRVRLNATLQDPPNCTVDVYLDIDARNPPPRNRGRTFEISSGETVDLGAWRLAGGDNIIVVRGQTDPIAPNTQLTFLVERS